MHIEKSKTYNAIDIANYIVDKCDESGHRINNLKLQYILFLLQKIYLKETGYPLFSDDICAWHFGPCVPNVYYTFCMFAEQGIKRHNPIKTEINSNVELVIDNLLKTKRTLDSWQATPLHIEVLMKYGAWDTVYTENGDRSVIPLELIKQEPYYIGFYNFYNRKEEEHEHS